MVRKTRMKETSWTLVCTLTLHSSNDPVSYVVGQTSNHIKDSIIQATVAIRYKFVGRLQNLYTSTQRVPHPPAANAATGSDERLFESVAALRCCQRTASRPYRSRPYRGRSRVSGCGGFGFQALPVLPVLGEVLASSFQSLYARGR